MQLVTPIMCLSPIRLNDADRTLVACRGCELCRANRLNDWVGRCLAEMQMATDTVAVTLTYAGDVPEAAILSYRDIQLFLKRLRRDNYNVRYIVAGEYGTSKGRAHWHIILFFHGNSPQIERDRRVNWEYWPHGFSYFQQPDYKGFRYVLKYALKDQMSEASTRAFSMSKKPPLGYDFFMRLADDLVSAGLSVHAPEYTFAGIRDKTGKHRKFWLQGRMREMFLERYCAGWLAAYGKEPPETEWLLERYLDPIAKREREFDMSQIERDIDANRPSPERLKRMMARIEYEDHLSKETRRSTGYLFIGDYQRDMIVTYSDATFEYVKGDEIWTCGSVNVARQLREIGLSERWMKPVCQWLAEKLPPVAVTSAPASLSRVPYPPGQIDGRSIMDEIPDF